MGSSFFYLEFLMTWLSLLSASGYNNPAIFALEYTLAPDASYPTQIGEALAGYDHVLKVAGDPSIVCVSGDSAGAMLVLSLLLHLTVDGPTQKTPAFAALISPWVTLVSKRDITAKSDYLVMHQLRRYGSQLAGSKIPTNHPLVSPGCCRDRLWWKRASPLKGIFISYGENEVLARETRELVDLLREANVIIESKGDPGGIHAWPVASLFLSSDDGKRLDGLRTMTQRIRERIPTGFGGAVKKGDVSSD